MKFAVLSLLAVLAVVSADVLSDYRTLSNAISSPRQRRSLEDHQLVAKFLDVLHHVEEFGSEKAKQAKAELMGLLEKVEDFNFGEWLESAKAKFGKREVALDDPVNQKTMDKVLLLAKMKFAEYKTKLSLAFDKLKKEFEPVGQKFKKYGESVSVIAANGVKKFANANVDIFNSFQEKVKANMNGLLSDGKSFLNLIKEKATKAFGK